MNLNVRGRLCVVVGAGEVARRKAAQLLEAGARVRVVAPTVTAELDEQASRGEIELIPERAAAQHLRGALLVVCATDDAGVNHAMAQAARSQGSLVNAADAPELSDFTTVSVVRRGHLQLAVSSDGLAPAVSRNVRRRLEELFGPEWAAYTELLGGLRAEIRRRFPHPAEREAAWARVLDSDLLEQVRSGDRAGIEATIAACLQGAPVSPSASGLMGHHP